MYNKHRQSNPVARNKFNRKAYIFISDTWIWRYVPFRSTSKWKYKIIYIILSFLKPHVILDINWINLKGGFYHLWAKKNRPSKFVVLQHGSYVGGIVTDIAHRYTHCDEFLTWGDYFTNYFEKVNCHKSVKIKTFGNPVYNEVDRNNLNYSKKEGIKKVLFAPSAVSSERKLKYIQFMVALARTDLEFWFKPHNMQVKIGGEFDIPVEVNLYKGDNLWSDFDLLISDISTILIDACFFKKHVLFFMPMHEDERFNNTLYAKYMLNLSDLVSSLDNKTSFYNLIDENVQEELFNVMIAASSNRLI